MITNFDGWTFENDYYYDTQFRCGNCQVLKFKEIKYSTQLPPHQDILIRFFKRSSTTIIIDYLYGKQIFSSANQQIEILIRNYHDIILQLIIQSHPLEEFGLLRDFEIFYTEPEKMLNILNEGCQEQIDDKCLICQEGWNQNGIFQNCHPVCGDGIIKGQEECDDGNLIFNDSCYLCRFKCIEFCQICQFGICLQCQDGFVINSNFTCDPLCGDGNLIPYTTEQCEMEVNGVRDGCQDCRFIQITNCKTNYYSICFECQIVYQMLESICFPNCGDKIVLEYYEDCDDGNLQPYDGCFQCKYSCPENCQDCYQGTCLECDYQYKLLVQNQCKQQLYCGDGLLQEQEECDDGNYQAVDGCINCLVEQNWMCVTITQDSPSQCTFLKAPNLIINYLNMTQNKQYINIQFSQKVKTQTTQLLSENINFQLQNIDKNKWNSFLYIIQDVGQNVSFEEFIVQIEVQQLLEFRPILKILINQTVVNIDNVVLEDVEKSITLKYPQFLDEMQKEYSYKLKNLNQNIIYSLSGIIGISLLLGSGDLFVEVLAILQFQQYLRYINLQFPQNLEIYFSVNDMITVQPFLDFFQFPQLLQFIDIQLNQEYSQGKFNIYKQRSSLIINLSCQIFQLFIFLSLILLLQFIKKALYDRIFCQKYFNYMSLVSLYINPKIVFKFSQSFYKLCTNLLKLEKLMSFQGVQKALILNGWDMIFKTLLYTRNIQTKNYIDIAQIIIVSIILTLYFLLFLNCFKGKQEFSKMNGQQKFEIVSVIRQFFFLLFLIYVQDSQIIQLGSLLLTIIFQITFLFNYRCIFNKQNYIVQMVVEISVLTFIFSSFLYIQECNEYFNEEKKIILGWIQAIILSKGIIIELIMICYNLLQKLISNCRRQPQIVKNPLYPVQP